MSGAKTDHRQKGGYIMKKDKMTSNSYQHFQQLFQHEKKLGISINLSIFGE
jgi:hypothetical protein